MILEQLLRRNVRYFPTKTAIIDGNSNWNFLELYQRSNRLANALLKLGAQRGSKVAFMEKNCHQFFEFIFGCAKMGAVALPVNFRLKGRELAHVINNSETEILICGQEFFEAIDAVRPELTTLRHLILINEEQKGALSYEHMLKDASDQAPDFDSHEDDTIILMYTTGTTGTPKGALVTHKSFITFMINIWFHVGVLQDDIFMYAVPFFTSESPPILPILWEAARRSSCGTILRKRYSG